MLSSWTVTSTYRLVNYTDETWFVAKKDSTPFAPNASPTPETSLKLKKQVFTIKINPCPSKSTQCLSSIQSPCQQTSARWSRIWSSHKSCIVSSSVCRSTRPVWIFSKQEVWNCSTRLLWKTCYTRFSEPTNCRPFVAISTCMGSSVKRETNTTIPILSLATFPKSKPWNGKGLQCRRRNQSTRW